MNYRNELDSEVIEWQTKLEGLAEALLILLRTSGVVWSEAERHKVRNVARAAIQRSMELPDLVAADLAWIVRTEKFAAAVSRLLLDYLERRQE